MSMEIKDRMIRSIARLQGEVILRSDLSKFGSARQVSRCISKLVDGGVIVRIGLGFMQRRNSAGLQIILF